jgi:hypothetical protein
LCGIRIKQQKRVEAHRTANAPRPGDHPKVHIVGAEIVVTDLL